MTAKEDLGKVAEAWSSSTPKKERNFAGLFQANDVNESDCCLRTGNKEHENEKVGRAEGSELPFEGLERMSLCRLSLNISRLKNACAMSGPSGTNNIKCKCEAESRRRAAPRCNGDYTVIIGRHPVPCNDEQYKIC
jgi:hypothetical protein